ncbi:MAG: hypothetical protein ACI8SE_000661 [Bacteroidia bacterium]
MLIGFCLAGCFTEEEPILPLPPYTTEISTYKPTNGQVYFSLKDKKIIKQNSIEAWDIAFSCAENNYEILLNTARGMGCFNTNSKDFYQDYKNGDYPWLFDRMNGMKNNSCIGGWGDFSFENPQSFGNVYLIHLGLDLSGNPTGIVKMQIEGFIENRYNILIGDLEGKFERHYYIEKNDSFNYAYLSFETSDVAFLEPPKNDWDFLITSYVKHKSPRTSPLFFSVTNEFAVIDGILLNPYRREIAEQFTHDFDELDFFKAEAYTYTDTLNFIGAKWYQWNAGEKKFNMSKRNTFVIRDEYKNLYALKFTKFRKERTTKNDIGFVFKSL